MINKRTDRIDLRVYPEAKEALQAAAQLRHKSVSEFILDSALGAADEILADRPPPVWFERGAMGGFPDGS